MRSFAVLEGVEILSNDAQLGAGLDLMELGPTTLIGGRIAGNGDEATLEGGGARLEGGILLSEGVNWAFGIPDNVPEDVRLVLLGQSFDALGANATFRCDDPEFPCASGL